MASKGGSVGLLVARDFRAGLRAGGESRKLRGAPGPRRGGRGGHSERGREARTAAPGDPRDEPRTRRCPREDTFVSFELCFRPRRAESSRPTLLAPGGALGPSRAFQRVCVGARGGGGDGSCARPSSEPQNFQVSPTNGVESKGRDAGDTGLGGAVFGCSERAPGGQYLPQSS